MDKVQNFLKHKWTQTVDWLKSIYLTKQVIWKLIAFVCVAIICFTCSFVFRDQILHSQTRGWDLIPGFLEVRIVQNTGIAFSGLSNADSSLVYFVQSIPVVIGIIALIFSKSIIIDIGLSFVLCGGLSNIIDRTLVDNYVYLTSLNSQNTNAVVDYLQFSFIANSAVFNFPDVNIIFGIIIIFLYGIVYLIIDYVKETKQDKQKPIEERLVSQKVIEEKPKNTNLKQSLKKINKYGKRNKK